MAGKCAKKARPGLFTSFDSGDEKRFNEQIEHLICALYYGPDEPTHVTDGLLLRNMSQRPERYLGVGVVIYIDGQKVEPLRVELHFAVDLQQLIFGTVAFGLQGHPTAVYGSKDHNRLENLLLADPDLALDWRRSFVFRDGRWGEARGGRI